VVRPRVAVAADGTLAAIHEPLKVTILELPSCSPFAELGTDPAAVACEIAWVGTPPRLLVLSTYDAHSVVHLVDPFGPRTIAEIRLESAMRLYAAVGSHALAIGAAGAAIVAASDRSLTPFQFPARTVPGAAGAAGSQFVVALPGAVEEWDPQTRMPKRRLKLPRPVTITAVGGSDRVIWMTTAQEPARIEVIPFVNRGQPRAHDLPEPILSVASHARSDLIACIGATSGRVWVIDLDGRRGLRMIGPVGIDRAEAVGLVIGRVAGVLAAQAAHATTVVTLDRPDRSEDGERPRPASVFVRPQTTDAATVRPGDDEHGDESPTSVTLASPALGDASVPSPTRPATMPPPTRPATMPPPVGLVAAPDAANGGGAADADAALFAAWRQRIDHPRAQTSEPRPAGRGDDGWRVTLALWARDMIGTLGKPALETQSGSPPATPIDDLGPRFDLSPAAERVLALLYGAHLLGEDGVAPIDVARVARSWDEALGRGELAAHALIRNAGSRVQLDDLLLRVLDERPPLHGELVGAPGVVSLLGPCVIVAAGPLSIVAEACLPSIGGAILAARDDADPEALASEARAYGAAPLWRVRPAQLERVPSERPFILVADDDATADLLGIPRLT
jgi:hypothetical protein